MPEAIGTPTQARAPRLTLNSDGERHTALNVATVLTFVGGIAAFALGFVVNAHLPATILGIAVFCLGMVTQLMSATREQRIFVVAGIIAAAVGAGLAIAHGGFG
jgi:hypothetical protein